MNQEQRSQKIKTSKKKYEKKMRQNMKEIVSLIGSIKEEEVCLITNFMLYPELLDYIINAKNISGTPYPENTNEAILKYILERKSKKMLPFPEITILLNQLGFNMNSKINYYLAWYLSEIIETNEPPLNQNWLDEIKEEVKRTQNQKTHTQTWINIIGNNNSSVEEIIGKILAYIEQHKEKYIASSKITETRVREPKFNSES